MCSTSSSMEFQVNVDASDAKTSICSGALSKRLAKLNGKNRGVNSRYLPLPRSREEEEDAAVTTGPDGVGRERMRKTISLYTESITGTCKGQVGRPPKRLLRRLDGSQQDTDVDSSMSPQKNDAKESRVKEKIEKLLRSPWDDRLKQSGKVGKFDEDMTASSSVTSPALSASARSILRKARLNLNKSTLQKIRNPASLQRLIPQSEEGKVEGRCLICDRDEGENTRKFGIVICEMCCSFVSSASDGPKDVFECVNGNGLCQVQGVLEKNRCLACWLGRILRLSTMPNLLHDRLRKRLPPILKDKIPTSLARCMSLGTCGTSGDKDAEISSHTKRLPLDPGGAGGGTFGNVIDLPGGWQRKTGSEVVVISPNGEKFRSMHKLEEYLKKQGISADARVLFGNSSPVVEVTNDVKCRPAALLKNSEHSRVVVTTLPGGWTRRIKWRNTGGRFDTYVSSPDGRTFRSKRELNSYFLQIGKVDDIHKYFPVVNGNSDSATPSSSDNTTSSTEPISSTEIGSEVTSDDKSPEVSEADIESPEKSVRDVDIKANKRRSSRLCDSVLKVQSNIHVSATKSMAPSPTEKNKASKLDRKLRKKVKDGKKLARIQSAGTMVLDSVSKSENIVHNALPEFAKVERKQKKPNVMRTRSLSISSRHVADAGLTDTTESEPEQKISKESSHFSRRCLTKDVATNSDSVENSFPVGNELCSAWNLDLYESAGESILKSDDSKTSDVKKSPSRSLRIRKKNIEDSIQSEVPVIVPDVKANVEASAFNLDRKQLSDEESLLGNILKNDGSASESEGISRTKTKTLQSPSPLFNETQKQTNSPKELCLTSPDYFSCSGKKSLLPKKRPSDAKLIIVKNSNRIMSSKLASKKIPSKKKFSKYQSFHFGNNWSRKVQWNEKGEGKVALLHSPDGQTFRSRIELLAYFKKAGKSKVDLDFYFPPVLKRAVSPTDYLELDSQTDCVTDDNTAQTIITEESESDISNDSDNVCVDSNYSPEVYRKGGVSSKRLHSNIGKILSSSKGVKGIGGNISGSEDIEIEQNEKGGPRVKHVCRSKAQVLGISRAVFPSEKEGNLKKRRREVVTVTEKAASGKILRKTVWCNKCVGCTTPNCQKCVNCMDMKKYGGPGTKKKPCIMRKCLNPRLSAKSAAQTASANTEGKRKLSQIKSSLESLVTRESSKSPPVPRDVIGVKARDAVGESPIEIKISTQDKSAVFVPRQMTRLQPDQKDRVDIAAGKKFVPGALVNIDYWQGYDVDEMLLSGFAITTASPLYPQTLCFRCGSVGKEKLLYCIWCCEGVHPFCMEDGEGPESDKEELFWICRRCAVCHVCGAPGADSLLRCSDCRNYYHMECLGPSAHSTCQPSPDRLWEAEMLLHLRESWPRQAVLYDANDVSEEQKRLMEDVVVHLQLDPLEEDVEDVFELEEPDIFPLNISDVGTKTKNKSRVEEEGFDYVDFDLDDAVCLEDRFIALIRDVDLHKQSPSPTTNIYGEELITFKDDEYLCLGYKKLNEYSSMKIEISFYRLLQIIHNELFDALGYPTWREMIAKNLVRERPSGRTLDSDTDTASEGESQSDSSDWVWEEIIEFRRYEVLQDIKEREEKRLEEERQEVERKREMARRARKKELEEGKEKPKAKNGIIIKRKKKRGRPPGSGKKNREDLLDFIVADDYCEEGSDYEEFNPRKARFRQPKSWEEFDRLFAVKDVEEIDRDEDSEESPIIKKRKNVFPSRNKDGLKKRGRPPKLKEGNAIEKKEIMHLKNVASKSLKTISKFKNKKLWKKRQLLKKKTAGREPLGNKYQNTKKKLLQEHEGKEKNDEERIENSDSDDIGKLETFPVPKSIKKKTKNFMINLDRLTSCDLIEINNVEIDKIENENELDDIKEDEVYEKEKFSAVSLSINHKVSSCEKPSPNLSYIKDDLAKTFKERKSSGYRNESGNGVNLMNMTIDLDKMMQENIMETSCNSQSAEYEMSSSYTPQKIETMCYDIADYSVDKFNKPEKEYGDSLIRNRAPDVSDSKLSTSLINGFSVSGAPKVASKCSEAQSSKMKETCRDLNVTKKRKLYSMREDAKLEEDLDSHNKVTKLNSEAADQSLTTSDSTYTISRRRRFGGRASLLASQRKAMMDYL
ncbi:hypothetical protein SK128_001899 [Halocaridina rubra]|uniref:Histone-lysine N-methyltransferase n=1 Tax=Halocaridina rubra TaxID=373956 RepID=A0AAN8XBX8_HALRR